MAEGVDGGLVGRRHAALGQGALGDDDDRRVLALEALLDVVADALDRERDLGDEDHVRAARDAGVEGDPAGVAAHHLDDQRALVALGRGVEAVDRAHRDVDGGVEAEGVVGGAQVVVDRLRHADDVEALLVEPRRDAQRVLAADRDQAVDAIALERLAHALDAALLLDRVGPRRAEDRSAARQDPAHVGDLERPRDALERPPPPVAVADELVAVLADALADDRADDRVEAGTVAAAGEDSELHRSDAREARASSA